jgi:hypothetical protein
MSSNRTSWEFGGAKGISRQETKCGCLHGGLGTLPRNVRVINPAPKLDLSTAP